MNRASGVVRIAHAYGNNRAALDVALAADVDMIEVDIWYRGGRIEIRHERRWSWLPVLGDRRGRALHAMGRFVVPLWGGYFVRPDLGTMRLDELLERTAGRKSLLLDVKARKRGESAAFASRLAETVARHNAGSWVSVCGQYWPVIRDLRAVAPQMEVRYSKEYHLQWERFVAMAPGDPGARRVCIEHRFMDAEKQGFLEQHGVDVYCWTVDDAAEAAALVERGVDGITSNDLGLLAGLPRPPSVPP
ncbi:MAG TPA: glycerophosphodiester phosphodiesterase [Dehalococcoidia bacterium]|nr:glycerophosphodiester phosphodiesterase [Dehalococcoidia bacterium]